MPSISSMLLVPSLLLASAEAPDPFDAISRPVAAGEVFYRWQSTTAAENLLKAGRMTETLNAHFMSSTDDALGPGLYVANTPTSSASFLPKSGGNLIEVHVDPGVPVIDYTDPDIYKRIKAAGLTDAMFEARTTTGGPLVMKYTDHWLVGKNLGERARFKPWPGPDHSAVDVAKTLDMLGAYASDLENLAHAEDTLLHQVIAQRPDLIRPLAEVHHLDAPLLRALPPADAVAAIAAHEKMYGLQTSEIQNLRRYLAEEPRAMHALAQTPETFDKVADAVVHADFRRLGQLDRAAFETVRALTLAPAGDPAAREARVAKMAEVALRDPYLWSTAARANERVLPLLAAAHLSPEDQEILATRIRTLTDYAGALNANEVGQLKAFAEHAGPRHADLVGHIEKAARTPTEAAFENACVASVVKAAQR